MRKVNDPAMKFQTIVGIVDGNILPILLYTGQNIDKKGMRRPDQ